MSLSFLKNKDKYLLVLLIILSLFNTVRADDRIPEPVNNKNLKNSDAYYLYLYNDVTYTKDWLSYKRSTSVQSKLVINNRAGVEQFAFLNLSEFVTDHLHSFYVNTLKADGTVLELDSSLVFEHGSDTKQVGEINYPIPGVEPGDTIEISYIYTETLSAYELSDFVNLYSPIPSLNTEFTIRISPDKTVKYKTYNGFPDPQVLMNDTITFCLFKTEQIEGLTQNNFTCLPCELPYLYYSVEGLNKEKILTWKDIYNQEYNILTQPILVDYEKSSYYKRWKKKVIGDAGDSSKYYKFSLLLNDIYNTLEIEAPTIDEIVKSSGFFLKEKRINPISIRRLYRQILEDLEIDYWAIFARSKRLGKIDPYFIRKGEYDHIFFAFDNGKESLSLLYPHDISYKYQINEIPTSLYNTQAIMAKPFLTEKIKRSEKFINSDLRMAIIDSLDTKIIDLPGMSANSNYLKQVVLCNVDINTKKVSFKSDLSLSGGLSTDVRSFFSLLNQDEEMSDFYEALSKFEGEEISLKIDTVTDIRLKAVKPFIYNIKAEGKLTKNLSFINDSLLSFKVDNLIHHSQIESDADSVNLNYYLDYCYSDFFMLFLIFPCDVELLSSENLSKDFKNDLGEYSFKINLVNNNQLIIQSNYKIIKDIIRKDDYKKLKDLNEIVEEFKNFRILIKLNKT